jgi:hypothetical protein
LPYFPTYTSSFQAPTAATPHKKKHGWWEELTNAPAALIGDIGSTLHGFGKAIPAVIGGIYHEGQHLGQGNFDAMWQAPRDTFSNLGHGLWTQYKDMYSPLFHGDVSTFGHNVLQHPLGPILDVLTIASAGLGAVGRGSRVIAGSSAFSKTTREAAAARAGLSAAKEGEQFIPRVYDSSTQKLIPDPRYAENAPETWGVGNDLKTPQQLKDIAISSARGRYANIEGTHYLPAEKTYSASPKSENGFTQIMKENPYGRYKQEKLAQFGVKHPNAPLVGITGRASRQDVRLGGSPARQALQTQKDILDKSNIAPELKATVTHSMGMMKNSVKRLALGKQLENIGTHEVNGETVRGLSPVEVEALRNEANLINHMETIPAHEAASTLEHLVRVRIMAKRALDKSRKNLAQARAYYDKRKSTDRLGNTHEKMAAVDAAKKAYDAARGDVVRWAPYGRATATGAQGVKFAEHRAANSARLKELNNILEGQIDSSAKYAGISEHLHALSSPYLKAVTHWDYKNQEANTALIDKLAKGMTEPAAERFRSVVTEKNINQLRDLRLAMFKAHSDVFTPILERKWKTPRGKSEKFIAQEARRISHETGRDYTEVLNELKPLTLEDIMQKRAAAEHNTYLDILGKDQVDPAEFIAWSRHNVPGISPEELSQYKPPFAITHMGHADTSGITRDKVFRGTQLGHEKKTTMFNAVCGLYNLDSPAALYRTMNTAIAAEMTTRRFITHMNNAIVHDSSLNDIPKGWELAVPGEAKAFAHSKTQQLLQFLSEDAKIIMGEDSHNIGLVQDVLSSLEQHLNSAMSDKGVLIAPKASAKVLFPEIQRSDTFIKKFFDKPTTFWRNYTLGLRPAWMVNNFMGNLMLLLAEHGTWNTIRAMIHGYGDKNFTETINRTSPELLHSGMNAEIKAEEMKRANLKEVDPYAAKKALAGESPSEPMGSSLAKLDLTKQILTKANPTAALNNLGKKMINFNAKWIDDPMRRAAAWAEIRPAARELQKKWAKHRGEKLPLGDAIDMILQDERVRDHIIQKSIGDMVNFSDMSQVEKDWIRRVFPFWSWMSGITKRTGQLAINEPGKFNALTRVGTYENQTNSVPGESFLQSYAPLGKTNGDLQKVVNTSGINPFASSADVLSMLNTVLPGGGGFSAMKGTSSPLSQMNPIIKAAIETGTGKNLFYGTPLREIQAGKDKTTGKPIGNPDMGLLDLLARRYASSFPQVAFFQSGGQENTPQSLFIHNYPSQTANYLGLPTRTMNIAEARRRKEAQRRLLQLAALKNG